MSKDQPPPAPNYQSQSHNQPGYSQYYPPNSQPPAYSQGYSQQYHQQQGYQPQYQQQQQQYQHPQYYAPQQQQPVYVQQNQRPQGFRPGSDTWAWCCGFLSLAMCIEMLFILF